MKYRTGTRKATLLLASTLTVMAGAIVAPSLPQIADIFKEIENIELKSKLVLTLHSLVIAFIAPFAGWFIDAFGRKKLLIFSLVLYAAAGTSGLYFENLHFILGGRFMLGAAVAGIMTSTTTLIADYFKGEERNNFLGLQAAFMAIGGLVYLSAGGFLADVHWRGPFAIYGVSIALVPFALMSISDIFRSKVKENLVEKDIAEIHKPTVILLLGSIFIAMAIFYMVPVQIPFILKKFEGINNLGVGLAIASGSITGALISGNYGKFKRRLDYPRIFAIAFLFNSIGYLIISQASTYTLIVAGIAISGFGTGFIFPNANTWIVALAPENLRGRLVGLLNFFLFSGLFLSPILIQPIVEVSSLKLSFFVCSAILLSMSLFYFFSAPVLIRIRKAGESTA